MKKLSIVSVLIATTTIATSVAAQSLAEGKLPPGYALCRTKALAPAAPPVNNIPECSLVDGVARFRIVKMQQNLAQVRGQVQLAQATASAAKESAVIANQRAAELEGRTSDLESRVANVQENSAMDIVDHESRIQKLEKHAVTTDGRLDGVEARLGDMEDMFPKLTLRGGLAAYTSVGDGDSYAGLPVTMELSLPVAPKYALSLEGGTTLSVSDRLFGVVGRFGVDYQLSEKVLVGPGLSVYGVGLDSSLDSSVMFTGIDGRVQYNLTESLVVGAKVMPIGMDASGTHDAKYAFGGTVFTGLVF